VQDRRPRVLAVPVLLAAVILAVVAGMPTIAAMPPAGPSESGGEDTGRVAVPVDALHGYYVHVDTAEQVVRVFLDEVLIRRMVCSTGLADQDNATPTGRFYIQNRGPVFFSEKYQQGARWWVSFRDWGLYLFHSVPIDRQGEVITEEAVKLGQPVSHGCVRLSMEDALWFYETIPQGAPVDIE